MTIVINPAETPAETVNLTLEEARKSMTMVEWTALEAACHIQGIKPISHEVFIQNRSFYPEIDYYFTLLTQAFNTRLQKGKFRYPNEERIAEPLYWLVLASLCKDESNPTIDGMQIEGLYMAPGIGEAWAMHIARSRIIREGTNASAKRRTRVRPFHEGDDRFNIMKKAREIYRQDHSLQKKMIVDRVFKDYPRAEKCYNRRVVTLWVTKTNVAPAKRGRPKK